MPRSCARGATEAVLQVESRRRYALHEERAGFQIPEDHHLLGAQFGVGDGARPTANCAAQRVFTDVSSLRVCSVIQFTSQVRPPSAEKACSKWGADEVVFDQIQRT